MPDLDRRLFLRDVDFAERLLDTAIEVLTVRSNRSNLQLKLLGDAMVLIRLANQKLQTSRIQEL